MARRTYWLDLFTRRTWQEFLNAGGNISGFRETRWKTVEQIQPGDYLLCYLVGVSRWVGVLEVTSRGYKDHQPIWQDESFPCRVKVKIVAALPLENSVPIKEIREQLSIFEHDSPIAWTGHLRGSPARWTEADGEAVVRAIEDRDAHPRPLPLPVAPAINAVATTDSLGAVTVPTTDDSVSAKEQTQHTEIQWLLLKIGNDMGLDVWVARNDRSRQFNGNAFGKLQHLRRDLPLQFDDATMKTIELIDVLWLRGNAIVAAFEIECTTSIYSGLLRMSDLVAMQPNLKIPLYLVAPEERREKVMTEVNRPTFSRLEPPLKEICRYLPIPVLQEQAKHAAPFLRHLKPEFLDDLAESCELEAV